MPITFKACKSLIALSTAFLAVTASAITSYAADNKQITVVLSYIPNVENFGTIYAESKGFFKEAGLDVEIVPGGSGVDGVQMIASGTAQIAITSPEPVIAAVNKGVKLKVIGARMQNNPQALTCRADSGITDAHMMKGKRIAIKQTATRHAEIFLGKLGMTTADIETLSVSGSDVSAVIAGKAACLYTTFAYNEPRLITNVGIPVNIMPMGDYGLNGQPGSITVTESFFNENKELLVAYMKAEARGWEEYFKDTAAAAEFMVKGGFNDGLDLDQQTYQAKHQADFMTSPLTKEKGILYLNPEIWAETAANSFNAKSTDRLVDPSEFLTFEILDQVERPKL